MTSSPPASPREPASGLAGPREALVKTAVWVVLVVFFAPGPGVPLVKGIDPSYLWGLGALPSTGAAHGRDVVFPYGPLSSVLAPRPAGGGLGAFRAAMAASWLLHAAWAAALAALLRRRTGAAGTTAPGAASARTTTGATSGVGAATATTAASAATGATATTGASAATAIVGFAVLTLLAAVLGMVPESRLVLLAATLVAVALADPGPAGAGAAVLAGALAPPFTLVRLSVGIPALAMAGVFAALSIVSIGRRETRRRGLATAAALAVSAAAMVPLAFPSPRDALRWLSGQAELARGFSGAMGKEGLPFELPAALLALAVFALLAAAALRARSPLARLWLVLAPAVLFAFKHGYARQDGHVLVFFCPLVGLLALGLLAGDERDERPVLAAALATLLVAVPAAIVHVKPAAAAFDLVLGERGLVNFRALGDLDGTAKAIARRSRRRLAPSRLPQPFAAEVRRRGVAVDVVPWELSVVAANGFRWSPSPTLQLYTAYTAGLDAWAARHFSGPRAPDLLLAEFRSIDGRNMVWDTPAAWRAVLARYAPLAGQPRPGMLALVFRPRALRWSSRPLGEARLAGGAWVAVPSTPGAWTFAHLELPLTARGRLATALLRQPEIEAEVELEDGGTRSYRVIRETAGGGLLLTPMPYSFGHFEGLFRTGAAAGLRAVRLRLTGPGAACLAPGARVVWRSWSLEDEPSPLALGEEPAPRSPLPADG